MRSSPQPVQTCARAPHRLDRSRPLGGAWPATAVPPLAQIQITPLIDVLLVLLVMGALAWAAQQAAGQSTAKVSTSPDPLQGLSLPLRSEADAAGPVTPTEDTLLLGIGPHGQLSWRGVPVTRDILQRQLQQALAQDARAEVWLAVDPALPYADMLSWLEWLQARHVTRLTLLSHSQPTASAAGKP